MRENDPMFKVCQIGNIDGLRTAISNGSLSPLVWMNLEILFSMHVHPNESVM